MAVFARHDFQHKPTTRTLSPGMPTTVYYFLINLSTIAKPQLLFTRNLQRQKRINQFTQGKTKTTQNSDYRITLFN